MIRSNRKRRLVYPVTVSDLVGIAIRRERQFLDLTQQDLANAIGVARSHICNIETGRFQVGLELLWDIAVALDVEARSLVPSTKMLAHENYKAKRRKR